MTRLMKFSCFVAWVLEDHDIASPRPMQPVGDLLDQQVLIGVQRWLHALTAHLGRLHDEQVEQNGNENRRDDALQKLAHN